MMTRKEYMDTLSKYGAPESYAHHRTYYAQFVTPRVKAIVLTRISLKRLQESKDRYFNDIPLCIWDSFWNANDIEVIKKLREAGECTSLATGVCIFKEAARQIVEEVSKNI